MAITATDIVFRLSTTVGTAGDSTAQADPNASLGKYVATTVMSTALNGLFDDVSGAENEASDVEYRCVFVLNNHATLTLMNAVTYISAEVSGGATIALAVDGTAASAKGSSSSQAALVANENTAPSGTGGFSSPTTSGTGLSLGSIGPGQVKAVWVRRTAANTAAVNNDGFTLAVTGDTLA